MSDELPEGWAMPLLGEVVKIKQGNSKLTKKWFKPDGKYVAFSGSGPDGLVDQFDHEGKAIVLSSVGARCGKCFKADGKWTAIANTAVIRPLLVDDSHYEYLFYLLNNENFWPKGGTAQPFVQTGLAQRETRIPLAPLAEQRRIVAKLEKLLGQVDACQQRLEKLPTLLKRFRQSILAAACSGRLTADWREENDISIESWRDAELRDICSSISDGDHLPPPQQPSGIPFLTIGNISSGRLDFSQTRFVSESYFANIKPDRIPKRGDTLYTVVGASIGVPVMVETDQSFCFQRHIAILKPSKETDPKFLRALMGSPAVFREGWARTTGSAQPTLPLGNLRTIPISIPPLAEQQEIVRRVAGLFALADQLEQRLAQARKQVDKLTPSLLARAFAGKLVPQNPADEPAEKLLERIHQGGKS